MHERGRAGLFTLTWVLLGCGGGEPEPASPPVASEESVETEETVAPPAASTVAPSPASPVSIVVLNDTHAAVVLDRSFGPAEPLGVAWLDGDLEPSIDLDQSDDARSGEWLSTCQCACGQGPCPQCEPPGTVHVTLQPGERYELPWNGRFRRREVHPRGGSCWSTLDPPRGHYVFTACTTDGQCGRTRVSLPASAPIEIRLSETATASACGDVAARTQALARARLLDQLGMVLRDRPTESCSHAPTCVAPAALDAAMQSARSDACTIFVVPRGEQLEVRAFLPLPPQMHGGESYAHFYDPDVTHLLRARYEQ